MKLDGDAARASRLAARGEGIDYTLAGKVWHFPPEMPMETLLAEPPNGKPADYLRWYCEQLLGPDQFTLLLSAHHPDGSQVSGQDIDVMVAEVIKAYSVGPGESTSSGESPAKPGESSSGTARAKGSTRTRSGKGRVRSAGSGASS